MSKDEKATGQPNISRREFLKDAGILAGGATIASLMFSSCSSSTTTQPVTSPLEPSVSSATQKVTSSTTTPPTSAPTAIPSVSPKATSTSTTTTAPATSSSSFVPYSPPITKPVLLDTPDCPSKVAADRVYSADHVWVKTLSGDIAVLGVSDKFQMLVAYPTKIELPSIGELVVKGMPFGAIEGSKLNTDLLSPVTGMVIDMNSSLITLKNQGSLLSPIIESPYNTGWMVVVRLSKPEELKSLLSADAYNAMATNIH